jgi:protoporphyrinogen oxidase
MRVGVLGGGAMGLTAAYRLASAGHQVVVIEKMDVLGGLAAGFPIGDSYLERFYHHLFGTDRDVVALIEELGLGDKLVWQKPKTSILWQGEKRRFDGPISVLRYGPLPFLDRIRVGMVVAYLKLTKDYHRFEGVEAERWLRRTMGRRATALLWEPLFKAKFWQFHDRVAMSWFWARIYCRTPQLGYVRGGFQQLYDRLGERIRSLGGRIELGREVRSIESEADGTVCVTTDAGEERFDRVLATLPTRLFAQLARGLPPDWLAKYDWGDWLGAHCVILGLDRPLTDIYWLNVNDPGYPFLALVDHGNFMPASDYGGLYPLYLGNYLPMSSERFRQSDAEILADYLPTLKRVNPSFDESWIKQSWVFKAPYAQPVVTTEYRHHIPPHETPLKNIYMANMFQVYPQDRGQNYSVRMANRVAELMLDSRSS